VVENQPVWTKAFWLTWPKEASFAKDTRCQENWGAVPNCQYLSKSRNLSCCVNLTRRSRFDQCTWISAFSLDQGRGRDETRASTHRLFGDGLENEAHSPRKTCFKVRGGAVRIRVKQVGRGGGGGGGRLLGSQGPSWAGPVVGPGGTSSSRPRHYPTWGSWFPRNHIP
ncbi:unnamed protein product, partial [Bubo scandiacus]